MKRTPCVTVSVILLVLVFVACGSRQDKLPGTEHFEYDQDGRLKSHTTTNGATISYRYDPTGRLSTITYPRWSSVDFRYNAAHDVVAIHDMSGTTEFKRDALGRISQMISPNGKALSYRYDPWGRV